MKSVSRTLIEVDADKWDLYKVADFTVTFILVIISMVSADIPRQRIEIVKKSAPYVARGWTPVGQQLNLPLRAPPAPAASYGPPSEVESTPGQQNLPLRAAPTPIPSYGPPSEAEPTTTEATTEENLSSLKSQNLEEAPKNEKENLENLDEQQQQQPEQQQQQQQPQQQQQQQPQQQQQQQQQQQLQGQFYVVLPQGQNVIYAFPGNAALLAVPKGDLLAAPARLQAMPFSSAVASSVYTPFSASYIQIYQ